MYIRRSSEVLQQLVFGPAPELFASFIKMIKCYLIQSVIKNVLLSNLRYPVGRRSGSILCFIVTCATNQWSACVCVWVSLCLLTGFDCSAGCLSVCRHIFWWRDGITTVQDAVRKNIRGVKLRSNLKAGFKDGSDPSKGAGSRRVGRRKEPLIADHWSLIWSMRSQLVKYWLL